ncbi:unnamed protein product [Dovyalis caffra]|uniref:GATA-type domain-containing protein n=1 Tax=Dovyalis caffra TaxID=77055 RepID=A0AAV1RUL9_9ROSI|nr:unnamed protein product [Dovyalis caffra]
MDSRWFHQATASNDGFNDKNNAGKKVDLNLKLGLAHHDDTNHQINISDLFNKPVSMTTPSLANFSFNGLMTTPSLANFSFNGLKTSNKEINLGPNSGAGKHIGVNHFGPFCNQDFVGPNTNIGNNRGGNIPRNEVGMMVGGFPLNDGPISHLNPCTHEMGSQSDSINLSSNGIVAQNTNPVLRAAHSSRQNLLFPPATLKNRVLLDFSPKNSKTGISSRTNWKYSRRQPEVRYYNLYKTCSDANCETINTPMWRRGPLGANTLCNACGIRYRKNEERKKAKEAANRPD